MQVLQICRHHIEEHLLRDRHRVDWGREFILLVLQARVRPGSDAGSDNVESVSDFVIENRLIYSSSGL